MKMNYRLLAVQLLMVGSLMSYLEAKKEGCCKAPAGKLLRCYSDNKGPLFPTGSGTFAIVNDEGCEVGYTAALNNETFQQKWSTKDGCLSIDLVARSSLFSATPIADATVAFPQVKPYVTTNPDAEVWVFVADHYKNDSDVTLSWKATGSFKNISVAEVRCVFLVFKQNGVPYIQKCLGCHWFFQRSK